MDLSGVYGIMSGVCFALTGLWWNVVEGRKDWLANPQLRGLAGGVYASFLIPAAMAIGAQIGGENKLVWRSVFVVLALAGMFSTTRLLARTSKMPNPGLFTRSRWLVVLIYLVVLVLGLFPTLAAPSGLAPIQVEAFLLTIIILAGHGLAWEMMTRQPE